MYKNDGFWFFTKICLLLVIKNVNSFDYDNCNPEDCERGPIRFYEDMFCTPVYVKGDKCCPLRYDCSEVDKYNVNEHCFADGHVYRVDEKINDDHVRDEKNCYCIKDHLNRTNINCGDWKCPEVRLPSSKSSCYVKYTTAPCESEVVCPENPLECNIGGETIKEGQNKRVPGTNVNKDCRCQRTIENGLKVAKPVCYNRKSYCDRESFFRKILTKKRAPLYHKDSYVQPQTYCPSFTKTYREGDTIQSLVNLADHYGKCTFGPLTMSISSKLNRYNPIKNTYSCANCECIIAPTLTCEVMPLDECQEKFEKFKSKYPEYRDKLNKCTLVDKHI